MEKLDLLRDMTPKQALSFMQAIKVRKRWNTEQYKVAQNNLVQIRESNKDKPFYKVLCAAMGCEVTDLRYYLKTGTLNKGLHDPIDILYGAVFSTLSDITIPKGIKRPFNVKKRNNNDVKNYAANNFKKSHASKAGKRELLTEGAILGQYIYCCRGTFEYAPEYVALHLDITVAKLKRLESAKISAVSKDLLDRTCRLFKCKPEHIQIFGDKLKKGDLRWRYNPN